MAYCVDRDLAPKAATPDNVSEFFAWLATSTSSWRTVEQASAAITFFYSMDGLPTPVLHPSVRLTFAGIKRQFSRPPRKVKPFTAEIIKALVDTLTPESDVKSWRTVFAALFKYSTFARYNCVSKVKVQDLTFTPSGLIVTFPSSKTDQLRQGQAVFVKATGSPYCPVKMCERYVIRVMTEIWLRRPNDLFDGLLFPDLGPLIAGSRAVLDEPMSYNCSLSALRLALRGIGVPDPRAYTEHSGRRGGATAAAAAGRSLPVIQHQGRWKSAASAQEYIDESYFLNNTLSYDLGL